MDQEFFEHSLINLEARYIDLLSLSKNEINKLKQDLDVKGQELNSVAVERDELDKEKQEALQQVAELSQQLADRTVETELILQQLQQVQKELEHYFLLTRQQSKMLVSSERLFNRSCRLASKNLI